MENNNLENSQLQEKTQVNIYNKNKKLFLIGIPLLLIAVSIGCYFLFFNTKKEAPKKQGFVCLDTQTKIYDAYKDAVVLVSHTYKYEISIKGCKPFYTDKFYGLSEKSITGTGFFVSQDGKIVTNHHVAEPWFYETGFDDSFDSRMQEIKQEIADKIPDAIAASDIQNYIENQMDNQEDDSYNDVAEATENTASVNDSLAQYDEETSADDDQVSSTISTDDITIKPTTVAIQIAMHNSKDKWIDCKSINVANDKEIDVAVLQTTNELLPEGIKRVINIEDANLEDQSIKPGSKAILIGYPMGMTLAQTKKGIKVQIYEGQINKESDGVSLQYNVTSTHGASGSPVFDQCGRLIAVNYAGFDQAQGYNFGIVAKHAKDLM